MRNYVATDRLNPNAVNARYGRPATLCNIDAVACEFSASSDDEALSVFYRLMEDGVVGYSKHNMERVCATLWRSKDWYGSRKNPIVR